MLGLVLYGLQARAEGWGASEINSFQDGRTLYYVRPHNGLSCRASWVSDSVSADTALSPVRRLRLSRGT